VLAQPASEIDSLSRSTVHGDVFVGLIEEQERASPEKVVAK
jgi:hypothetical protein